MNITIVPTAATPFRAAPVATRATVMPSPLPTRVRTSLSSDQWRHLPGNVSRTQADLGAVAKQASPPRGTG